MPVEPLRGASECAFGGDVFSLEPADFLGRGLSFAKAGSLGPNCLKTLPICQSAE
jgi:hypothetical protein